MSSYKILTKRGFGINKGLVFYDEEVINNKSVSKEINYLFVAELMGVFIMIIGINYFLLM